MRLIYYKDLSINVDHYINLDRVDCFDFIDGKDFTKMYVIMSGGNSYLVTTKKITNIDALLKRLDQLTSGCSANIEDIIDDVNAMEKLKSKRGVKLCQ